MLLEEAEKLYNKLTKELVDESISDYDCSISSPSLPSLPPSEELQHETCQPSINRRQEDRFIQSSRIHNGDEDKDDEDN